MPSGKVVVGVSSYGRSFAMAEAGCHTADCLFTGTATQSNAEKGPCTVTAGYIGDAEIYAIISGDTNTTGNSKRDSSFVNQNYVDKASNSRILVYGDTQWVAYMDADIRSERASLYQGLSMGGSTNWASDLETYNPAPDTSTSWASFKEAVGVGGDPYAEGTRSGNWTSLTCSNPAVENALGMAPYERWDELDCDDAWNDILNVWQNHDKAKGWIFTESVANTIHVQENTDCGTLLDTSNCVQTITCQNVQGGSGPAGYEIWNSFVLIHEVRYLLIYFPMTRQISSSRQFVD